jgi:hypothetical protein
MPDFITRARDFLTGNQKDTAPVNRYEGPVPSRDACRVLVLDAQPIGFARASIARMSLYRQMVGRGLGPSPDGKLVKIFDHGGCVCEGEYAELVTGGRGGLASAA